MNKIAIVFWSGTGNTEAMAGYITEGVRAAGGEPELLGSGDFSASQFSAYSAVTFGRPAMGSEVLKEAEFEPIFSALEGSLSGKRIALFGSYVWGNGQWMRDWCKRCDDAGANLLDESSLTVNAVFSGRHVTRRNAVIEALKDRGKLCASCGTAGIQGSAAGAGAPSANPAYANTQTVLIDDKAVTFQTCALKDSFGKLTNRIRIWDIAYSLNGAKVQFGADWFYGLVNLLPSQPYTSNGSEFRAPFSGNRTYQMDSSTTDINKFWKLQLKPIVLYDDKGGRYTCYKFRELGKVLGFNVSYINGRVVINTNESCSNAQ